MRFIKAYIYGFGKWMDESLIFNEHGITCIVGDNESGKSTFQAFISFVLFGLSPKDREFYRPKTSGILGGELVVQLTSGEKVTIKRVDGQKNCAATCLLESGEEQDEEWLKTILKGMTSDLFAATFQFTTEDLYAFEQIKVSDIGEALLNASISGASHLHQVERGFDRALDELFKPRGTRPKINEQLSLVESTHKQLHNHVHLTDDYRGIKEKITKNNSDLNVLQQHLIDARKQRITWEQVETALPFIQQYEQSEKNLEKSADISFDEDGPKKLAEQKSLYQEYMSNDAMIQRNIDRYVEEMREIPLLNQEVIETGNAILQEKDDWSYCIRVQHDLKREKDTIQTEIHTKMSPFVSVLPDEEFKGFTIPPFIEKRWRDLAREAERLDNARSESEEAVQNQKKSVSKLEEQIARTSLDILPNEQVNKMKEMLDKDAYAQSSEVYAEQLAQEKSNQKREAQTSYRHSFQILIGSHVLASLFVVLAIFTNMPWFVHGAIISAAVGWIQWYFKWQVYKGLNQPVTRLFSEVKTRLPETERTSLQKQLDAHVHATESMTFLEKQKDDAKRTYEQLQGELNNIIQAEGQMNQRIEEEVLLYPFLDRVELPYWEELGHVLKDVQALHIRLTEVNTHLTENEGRINTFEERVRLYAENIWQESTNDQVPTLLSKIEQMMQEDVKYRQRVEQFQFEKNEAIANQKHIQDKLAHVKKTIHNILQSAHADNEEEFFQQHETYLQQQHHLQQAEEAKQQLIRVFSSSSWDQYVHQAIDAHTVSYELEKHREKIGNYEKEIEEVRAALATAYAELSQLEKSDSLSYSEHMHTFEIEKEYLQQLAIQWATYQVANSTLQKTKETYMSKHLDAVLERGAKHFSFITNQRYIKIHVDPLDALLSVVDTNGISYIPKELSKGTRDQLYISIRLAMSEHIQENTPFPFIFDDSFVHFDQGRTHLMIQLIIRLGQKQQIILFTCKDEIQEIVGSYVEENQISMVRIQ